MTSLTPARDVLIVAAKRTALGRPGGLHRRRRVEDLGAPVIRAALEQAGVEPAQVDAVLVGNTLAGGNPARLVALAAGLPETVPALTLDRGCASGLDAIVMAARLVRLGEAQIALAGGLDSLSTAPWRIAKPRTVYQTPRFEASGIADGSLEADPAVESAVELARGQGLGRDTLDAHALRSHIKAYLAHEAKRFIGEIVPLKCSAEEGRDEAVDADLTADDLAEVPAYEAGHELVTPANLSQPCDGASMAVLMSAQAWKAAGSPPALRLVAACERAVGTSRGASASIEAARALAARAEVPRAGLGLAVETSESCAAEALALGRALALEEEALNADGGALARGHALAASGAIAVARLHSRLVRHKRGDTPRHGLAVQGARGGLAVAALVEAV